MTSSINDIQPVRHIPNAKSTSLPPNIYSHIINEEPVRLLNTSNTRTTSLPSNISSTRSTLPSNITGIRSNLPSNISGIRSSSLPSKISGIKSTPNISGIKSTLNISGIRSASLPPNTFGVTTSPTNISSNIFSSKSNSLPPNTFESSSLSSFPILERRRRSDENNLEKISRRHARYDPNWQDLLMENHIETRDSAKDVTHSIQEEPSSTLASVITSQINNNDNKVQDSLNLRGITVTTVKVVEISEVPLPNNKIFNTKVRNDNNNLQQTNNDIKQQKKLTAKQSIPEQKAKERRKTKIYNNLNQDDIAQLKMLNSIKNDRVLKLSSEGVLRRNSSKRRSLSRPGATNYKKSHKRHVQRREMVNAPTSNPYYSNDPTDMEDDVNIPIKSGTQWIPVFNVPPKLLHASLIPLSQVDKKLKRISIVSIPPKPSKKSKSKRKHIDSILISKPKSQSQLFRQDLLQQSVAMSLNEAIMGRNVFDPRSSLRVPRRRFSRKGSNAKLEDRDTRRERRRREKAEKMIKEESTKVDNVMIQERPTNTVGMRKILETDELNRQVEEELRKKAILQIPQPPPRHYTQQMTREIIVRRQDSNNSNLSLISSLPNKQIIEFEPSDESNNEPFPTHLSRHHMPMHKSPMHIPIAALTLF